MLDQIEAFFNLVDRYKKYRINNNIADRVLQVFESHGVNRNQIPSFFGHDLALKDVQNSSYLLEKLSDSILEDICETFAINRAWLDGTSSQIHNLNDFYKKPEDFEEFIKNLVKKSSNNTLFAKLYFPTSKASRECECFFIIEETIGYVNNEPIKRIHLCSNFTYKYWKSRLYLTACIALAFKNNIFVKGYIAKNIALLNKAAYGEALIPELKKTNKLKVTKTFNPELLALDPFFYLKDVDPEKEDFGVKSATRMWLEYADKGLMDTGFSFNEAKEKFKSLTFS